MTDFLHGVDMVEIDSGSRPIATVRSSVIGVVGTAPDADASVFPENKPVLLTGRLSNPASLGEGGTLPDALRGIFDQCGAMVVVVRVAEGDDDAATITNVTGTKLNYTGVYALLTAAGAVHVTPRILVAPGHSHEPAVATALQAIAHDLKAVAVLDAKKTTNNDAIKFAETCASSRCYVVHPEVKVWGKKENDKYGEIAKPASSRVAGVIARTDTEKGFWWSPSNQAIQGILGTAAPVEFILGNSSCAANHLNENKVATIIHENGYRLWGNRSTTADAKWQFLSVRRTADMINESLQKAHLWAVDRNITKTYVQDVMEGVRSYLRHLEAQGAILGGDVWADPELNTAAAIQDGKVYFDFEFTPPYPAERVTFRSHMVNDYIEEVFK